MTDTTTPTAAPGERALTSPGERGTTTIADSVVAKIVSIAVREVDGVASLGGSVSGAMSQVVGRIRGKEHDTAGVGVEVGQTQAAIDLSVRVQYPVAIPDVTEQIRQNVIDRVETLVGLNVVEVNIAVVDLVFPQGEDEAAEQPAPRVQ